MIASEFYLCVCAKCRADVKDMIHDASDLAPLHNPANIKGIEAAEKTFPAALQVAVFDTAFHQTMPPEAYTYALPKEICESYHLRKYGFHGTSYKYLCGRAAAMVGKSVDNFNGIMCHLGAGASVCVVQNGKSIDTTMGLTPLQGLMMATRCGMCFWKILVSSSPDSLPFLMHLSDEHAYRGC